MFWKKKKKCEHEWVYIDNDLITSRHEIYCPKCNISHYHTYKDTALSCVKKSQLRKKYLDSQPQGES